MTRYKLYAGKTIEIPDEVRYSFYEPHKYLLIFTDIEVDKTKFREVSKELERCMSDSAHAWYVRCKMEVLNEALAERKEDIIPLMDEFISAFERRLQEKTKQNEVSDNGGTDN